MRVAVFVCNYNLGASAAIFNTCLALAEHGIGVDVFSYNNTHEEYISFPLEEIRLYLLSPNRRTKQSKKNNLSSIFKDILKKILPDTTIKYFVEQSMKYRARKKGVFAIIPVEIINQAEQLISKENYTAFIGVEPGGLILAGFLGGGEKIPLIYLSLELYLESDPRFQNLYYEIERKYEREFHKKTVATITQDQERAELLAKHNNVPISNFMIMPVAMKGEPIIENATFLYDRLQIPKNRKILLCLGGINEDRLSLETAMAASSLPEEWVMVLHGWYESKSYFKKIEQLCGEKLYISTDMIPFHSVVNLVSSAHVGLCFYKNMSENERLVGSASGKLAHYFQCGLPVIANDIESIKKIVDSYNCGICVPSPSYITEALNKIIGRYDDMRKNAFRCYTERYEISSHFEEVINLLKKLKSLHGR